MHHCLKILALICLMPTCVMAEAGFEEWKTKFAEYAIAHHVPAEVVDTYVPNLTYLDKVILLDRQQPEFVSPLPTYLRKSVTEERIEKGKKQLHSNKDILQKIEQQYGVPAPYLIAFWGLETHYGQIKGKIDVLDALATLAYDNRRSVFFTGQLVTMLKIIATEKIEPPQGSWAGAFGHFQFMPTTYFQYAVDGDKDGQRDVMSFPDAVASAAHYLSQMGWDNRMTWGRQAVIADTVDWNDILDKTYTLDKWWEKGVTLKRRAPLTPFEEKMTARLILPLGAKGPVFLVYSNFDVIRRWNKSDFYALAIGILADSISGRTTFDITKLPCEDVLYNNQIISVQEVLQVQGFYPHTIDGKMGSRTRQALQAYQSANGLVPDGYLSKELLAKILKSDKRKLEK